jgi:hypothetical protein
MPWALLVPAVFGRIVFSNFSLTLKPLGATQQLLDGLLIATFCE